MSEPAHHLPEWVVLSCINANFFRVNVWICEIELYICYVNNDKQTHNDMNTVNLPHYTLVFPDAPANQVFDTDEVRATCFHYTHNSNFFMAKEQPGYVSTLQTDMYGKKFVITRTRMEDNAHGMVIKGEMKWA